MPAIYDPIEARKLIARRHPEYVESVKTSSWLLDTLEGGDRYKDAEYGEDRRGKPVRNLYRHKREYPDLGMVRRDPFGVPLADSAQDRVTLEMDRAIEQDYETRRQRTPVPHFMREFLDKQLAKIFNKPIRRAGPERLTAWIDNIDGRETTLEEWMRDTIGPLLKALGMIDVQFEHPFLPEGEPVLFGDDLSDWRQRCIAWYILPTNMLWWRPDWTRRYYLESLVLEYSDELEASNRPAELFRHWTHLDWTLYDREGKVIETSEHPYGVVPIVRLFDQRNLRTDHTATSRMWSIADLSRQYYNEESELVANNTLHNCPQLVGPDDDGNDDSVPIGRGYMLQKVTARDGSQVGYEYLAPPTENAQFMRVRLFDQQERMERQVALTRTVGSVGTQGGSSLVAQSGISKAFDQQEGSESLAFVAKTLEIADYTIQYFALGVLYDGFANVPDTDINKLVVVYPKKFNLLSFSDFAAMLVSKQQYISGGLGKFPTWEKEILKSLARMMFPDFGPDLLKTIDAEIDEWVDEAVQSRKTRALNPPPVAPLAIGDPTQAQPVTNGQVVGPQ